MAISSDVVTGSFPTYTHTITLGVNPVRALTTGDTVSISVALKTGLDTDALPCIRQYQAQIAGATPVSIYTSAKLQAPVKVTGFNAQSTFYLNGNVETATASGTPTNGEVVSIAIYDTGFSGGVKTYNYTTVISVTTVVVSGTPVNTDAPSITITNPGYATGSAVYSYPEVVPGDTNPSIAAGLAAAINADTVASGLGINATSIGATVYIVSAFSPTQTTYAKSNGTHTTTLTLTSSTGTTFTNLNTIAAGLALAINSDTIAQGLAITAVSNGAVVSITSNSPNTTTYTVTNSTHQTLTLAANAGAAFGSTVAPLQLKTYNNPRFCSKFYNRMVYAGFTGSDTAFDIVVTNGGTFANCTLSSTLTATDGGVIQSDVSLGPITGLYNLRTSNTSNNETLIVACQNGVAIIDGTDATNFAYIVLTREYGILSNRSWVQLQNDVCFPTTNGIRRYSDLIVNATLVGASLTLGLADIYNQVNIVGADKIHACHNLPTQEVQFWIPFGQKTLTHTQVQCLNALIMNYSPTDDNTSLSPIWSTRDGTAVAASIYFNTKFFGGGYDGLLQQHYSGNLYDNAAIQWTYRSPLLGNGNIALGQSTRTIEVITEGGSQHIRASWFLYDHMDNESMRRRQTVNQFPLQALQVVGTALDSWIIGQGAFPSNHIKLLKFEPEETGKFSELVLQGIDASDTIDYIGFELINSVGGTRT